ncbi:hypothetical protein L6R53_17330 [Myxococcota bacterium]|nr:hypothetical protein [Myxococcota bacterium]
MLILLSTLLLACDEEPLACTQVGCQSELVLVVVGPDDVSEVSGLVTVGGQGFVVDCEGKSDPAVSCEGDRLVLTIADELGGGEVQWSLSSDGRDSGGGGGGYAGDGTVTPDWAVHQPNGEECPPTCYTAEVEVELLGTP